MKLIKSNYEILDQAPGFDGIYEAIERAGRTCYKSKRPEGQTAKDFVDRMIASQHYAMLEHGTVYLYCPNLTSQVYTPKHIVLRYKENPYSKVKINGRDAYITSNLRVLQENDWLDDLQYLCEPTEYHEKRVTVRFTTSNGIMREFTRHRSHSFAVESTRYCNYSKDKFNNELTLIIPSWSKLKECQYSVGRLMSLEQLNTVEKEAETNWLQSLASAEVNYLHMIKIGYKPQEAREVLPLATKCDMVMTGFVSDWNHFFDLRARGATGAPHPDAKTLAEPLMGEFYKRNLLN